MAEDIGSGTEVEFYRGKEWPPMFIHGARFTVERVWQPEDYDPCPDCLPGYNAPAIELVGVRAEFPFIPPDWLMCSCTFRPVNRPPPTEVTRVSGEFTPVKATETA